MSQNIQNSKSKFKTDAKIHESESSSDLSSSNQNNFPQHVYTKPRRIWRSIQRIIWDDPDKPKEEKWFLFKLDVFFLTASCLGYFSKNLDQSNIANAYVSGMKEALHMNGSELTYAGNVFTAGYVIGQLPAAIIVTKVRPSLVLPTLEVLWAIFTFCAAAVKTPAQLYAIRFLVGLCEAAFFPTMVYMLGSWYTKQERGKRLVLFYSSASFAAMFSGYLQAGVYKGLNGTLGHAGWQWLFIVCGIISIVIGFSGFILYPDFPETTKAFYITEKEAEWARKRLTLEGQKPLGANAWNRTKIWKIVRTWQFWILPLGYFFVQGSLPIYQPVFALWLKSKKHSVYEVNVWPTGQTAVGLVVQIIAAMISDSPILKGRRWQAIIAMQSVTFFSAVVLAVWTVPDKLKYVAYYLLFSASGVPGIYYAWYPDLIPHDHEMRGFIIACSNTFSYIQSIWFTLAVWRTKFAPRFKAGFIFAATLGVALAILVILLQILQNRDDRKRAEERQGRVDTESPASSEPHPFVQDDFGTRKQV